jgi:hypothetical protein
MTLLNPVKEGGRGESPEPLSGRGLGVRNRTHLAPGGIAGDIQYRGPFNNLAGDNSLGTGEAFMVASAECSSVNMHGDLAP